MLDYVVATKVMMQAVRCNAERFPPQFMFQLTQEEHESPRAQIVTLGPAGWGQHTKYRPHAFMEQGSARPSAVLRSKTAIRVSIPTMDAFVPIEEHA